VANLTTNVGPLSINHQGQLPAVTVSFNLLQGFPLGNAVSSINRLARENLPDTISSGFQGTAQAFETSIQGLGLLLALAILVFILSSILYETPSADFFPLFHLPVSALITLIIFGAELSIYAFVG
jgi:HAE1 family hydrophobic/amphiphilic exporter-1